MSIASRITEMETHINNAYTSIDNLGIDISNTNKNIYNISTLLDTFYERLPKVSGIGSSISLSPTMAGKIKLNEIQGNTLQENTPTPSSPVPIQSVTGLQNVSITGKNLLDFENATSMINLTYNNTTKLYTSSTLNSDYAAVSTTNANTPLNVNDGDIVYFSADVRLVSGTYSKTINKIAQTTNISATVTSVNNPTLSSTFQRYVFKSTYSTSGTITGALIQLTTGVSNVVLEVKNIMTSKSNDTTYEPYKGNTYEANLGNIELNKIGDYEDSIKKSTGKNLVYEIEQGSFNYQTGAFSTNANIIRTKKIPVKPNTTYTISSKLALGECCTYFYENNGTTGIAGSLLISTTTVKSASFTTPNNAYYMIFRLGASSVPYSATDDNNIMLNEGTALPYEPYGKVWYVEKNIGKVVLNGSETWTNFTTVSGSSNTMSQIDLPMQFLNRDGYTDRFPVIPDYSATEHFVIAGGLTHLYVHILNSRLSTLDVAGFKSWLASNITTFYYVLKTPIYEVITNTELIEQLESLNNAKSEDGTTNINVDGSLPVILGVKALKGE